MHAFLINKIQCSKGSILPSCQGMWPMSASEYLLKVASCFVDSACQNLACSHAMWAAYVMPWSASYSWALMMRSAAMLLHSKCPVSLRAAGFDSCIICSNFQRLSPNVKKRLAVENDDKATQWSVADLLPLHDRIGEQFMLTLMPGSVWCVTIILSWAFAQPEYCQQQRCDDFQLEDLSTPAKSWFLRRCQCCS